MATMTTGGNHPAYPVPEGQPKPLATSSPVRIMDWQSTLAQGNTNPQTREVGQSELVSKQLTDLTSGNSKYIQTARDRAGREASSRGMMTSSLAAGNAEAAAIDRALPIAQQDASSYGRVADNNMAAVNTDRLADQQMHGNLTGQEVGIRANLDEAERGRGFQTNEREASQGWQTGERVQTQGWQAGQNAVQREHEYNMQEAQRLFEGAQKELDRTFTGTQNDKQLAQQRFQEFNAAMRQYNDNLTQTLNAIYSNTALKPAEQAAAAANARAVHQSLYQSYAATMTAGVPQIFWNPYPMQGGAPATPTNPNLPPPTTTVGGGGGTWGGDANSGGTGGTMVQTQPVPVAPTITGDSMIQRAISGTTLPQRQQDYERQLAEYTARMMQ